MAFIALTTNLGLCVDGLWVPDRSGPPVGPRAPDAETPLPKIVALQGIHDPDGLYVTFDCALPADTPNLALTCQMLPAERQAALESDTRQAVADVVAASTAVALLIMVSRVNLGHFIRGVILRCSWCFARSSECLSC